MVSRTTGLAVILAVGMGLAACDRTPAATSENPDAATPDRPVRKPGLWKQTLLVAGAPYVQDARLCLDAESEKVVSWWGKKGLRRDCVEDAVVQKPDGSWRFSSVCVSEDHIKTTTLGTAVGDFQRRYQLAADLTISDPTNAARSGTRSVTLDAEWLGPCPADMKPGQLSYPDGQTINLMDLSVAPDDE